VDKFFEQLGIGGFIAIFIVLYIIFSTRRKD
jgi:hypothetical protein